MLIMYTAIVKGKLVLLEVKKPGFSFDKCLFYQELRLASSVWFANGQKPGFWMLSERLPKLKISEVSNEPSQT